MISIMADSAVPDRQGISRRELLRAGALSLLGLTTADLDRLRAAAPPPQDRRRAKACVFVFLFGGPSHIDLWDMKPAAPAEVRGEFRPAATRVPGLQLCEHLPLLAGQADKLCLLRSMTHHMPVHGPACSEMYTGREYFGPPVTDEARSEDWPSVAALVTRYAKSATRLPAAVVLPWHTQFVGQSKRIAGQTGGRMGERFNPVLLAGDPSGPDGDTNNFRPRPELGAGRLSRRRSLLAGLEAARGPQTPASRTFAGHSETAYAMLQQPAFFQALDLRSVPVRQRQRYGRSKFGQSLLLARRLVEAGIPLITVNWDDESKTDKVSPFWDTHHNNFPKLKGHLCPLFDRAFAAFLEDLHVRGLLENTLVVVTGEFGRTPRIGQFTQNNMTEKTGRDHWPHAFTVLLAGGGVRGGQVYGATTSNGGFVADKPVTPADLAATILSHLGVDTSQRYRDGFQNVRQRLCEGRPVQGLG